MTRQRKIRILMDLGLGYAMRATLARRLEEVATHRRVAGHLYAADAADQVVVYEDQLREMIALIDVAIAAWAMPRR